MLSAGVDVKIAFLALNILSLLVLLLSLFNIVKSFIPNKMLYIPIFFTPVLIDFYKNFCLPELFYAALLGLFFLLLLQGRLWSSLAFLFLLFMTRENTINLSLCI